MKKVIPFKKEIKLENDFEEILSIALEHTYKSEDLKISGEFIISGEYKSKDKNEPFVYNIPFQISLDDKYILDNIDVTIDDFYYEIKGNYLIINIELSIENLEERCIEEDTFKQVNEPIKLETKEEVINEDKYTTYKVYIVEENDTIESICTKYNTTKEELEKYNDLTSFNLKDKIIIPYIFNEETK